MEGCDDAQACLLDLTVHVGEELVQYYSPFVVVTESICRLCPIKGQRVCFSIIRLFLFLKICSMLCFCC